MIIEMHFRGPAENCHKFANREAVNVASVTWPHNEMVLTFEFDHDDECRAIQSAMDCVNIDACDEYGIELWGM